MAKKPLQKINVKLDKIVGGGQVIATLETGLKLFVWGGLPDETVTAQITKKKSHMAEGNVVEVLTPSPDRVEPKDGASYLSTSPWQIMNYKAELHYKAALIEEAFELHDIVLPDQIEVYSDDIMYGYRNKVEFSWWWDKDKNQLDLAFFKRNSHGKIPVENTSLANPAINMAAKAVRDILRSKPTLRASMFKTLLVRCDQLGRVVAQLYVKEAGFSYLTEAELEQLKKQVDMIGFELILSEPKSPASVITKKLLSWGKTDLTDQLLGIAFNYAAESFFQINLPVYETALKEIRNWINPDLALIDFYSGVGTIGLSVTKGPLIMVESNEQAINEMKKNIARLGRDDLAHILMSASEKSLDIISGDSQIIVDPPRAGLHENIRNRLLAKKPKRIIYLSCNPVTQARDVAELLNSYKIIFHKGYNFFPRTPHIEHLVILELN
jgi:23S rRNA (uracil1939-C5)-methyltransferase